MTIAVVVGNPKPGSRTLRVAEAVARSVADVVHISSEPIVVDLAEVAPQLFDYDSTAVNDLLRAVADCRVIVVASPTFKATYTGLLKSFFDRYGNNALHGTVCIPVMTGAAPLHALAPEVYLRPLLVELGASVPTRGLFVTEQRLEDLNPVISSWIDSARPILQSARYRPPIP